MKHSISDGHYRWQTQCGKMGMIVAASQRQHSGHHMHASCSCHTLAALVVAGCVAQV